MDAGPFLQWKRPLVDYIISSAILVLDVDPCVDHVYRWDRRVSSTQPTLCELPHPPRMVRFLLHRGFRQCPIHVWLAAAILETPCLSSLERLDAVGVGPWCVFLEALGCGEGNEGISNDRLERNRVCMKYHNVDRICVNRTTQDPNVIKSTHTPSPFLGKMKGQLSWFTYGSFFPII